MPPDEPHPRDVQPSRAEPPVTEITRVSPPTPAAASWYPGASADQPAPLDPAPCADADGARRPPAPAGYRHDRARGPARRRPRRRRALLARMLTTNAGVAGLDAGVGDARALHGRGAGGVAGRPRRDAGGARRDDARSWRRRRSGSRSWPTRRRSSGTPARRSSSWPTTSRACPRRPVRWPPRWPAAWTASSGSSATCRTPTQYDPDDLARFTSDVQTVCAQATDANAALQRELER